MPYCVGLTGGIGCGKSKAADMFAELGAAVLDLARRQLLDPLHQQRGLGPAVGLDDPRQDPGAPVLALAGLEQHRIGLAHAGGGAEEDLEPGAGLALLGFGDALEELVGIGTGSFHGIEGDRRIGSCRAAPRGSG